MGFDCTSENIKLQAELGDDAAADEGGGRQVSKAPGMTSSFTGRQCVYY